MELTQFRKAHSHNSHDPQQNKHQASAGKLRYLPGSDKTNH